MVRIGPEDHVHLLLAGDLPEAAIRVVTSVPDAQEVDFHRQAILLYLFTHSADMALVDGILALKIHEVRMREVQKLSRGHCFVDLTAVPLQHSLILRRKTDVRAIVFIFRVMLRQQEVLDRIRLAQTKQILKMLREVLDLQAEFDVDLVLILRLQVQGFLHITLEFARKHPDRRNEPIVVRIRRVVRKPEHLVTGLDGLLYIFSLCPRCMVAAGRVTVIISDHGCCLSIVNPVSRVAAAPTTILPNPAQDVNYSTPHRFCFLYPYKVLSAPWGTSPDPHDYFVRFVVRIRTIHPGF